MCRGGVDEKAIVGRVRNGYVRKRPALRGQSWHGIVLFGVTCPRETVRGERVCIAAPWRRFRSRTGDANAAPTRSFTRAALANPKGGRHGGMDFRAVVRHPEVSAGTRWHRLGRVSSGPGTKRTLPFPSALNDGIGGRAVE